MDHNKNISELTVGELIALIRETVRGEFSVNRTVTGLQGLADLFGVSISQAKRIKASGVLNPAISQSGRTIVVDADKALELFEKATHGRHS